MAQDKNSLIEESKVEQIMEEILLEEETKRATSTIKYLQSVTNKGVLKGHNILPLTNIKTLEYVGISVELRLGTRFTYTSTVLDEWKKRFGAHEYSIFVNHQVLYVKFKVHFAHKD